MSGAPVTAPQPLQGGESRPATPANPSAPPESAPAGGDLFPDDIRANCRDLSVEEHYRIARMPVGEVARRYIVPDPAEFVARVKAAIRFWDGVEL